MNSRAITHIEHLMQRNRWTIDRTAAELNTDTPTLRWFLNEWPAESVRQQMRLNAIVSAVDAYYIENMPRPTLMRIPRPSTRKRGASDVCANGHRFERGSYQLDMNGRRRCFQCQRDRKDGKRMHLAAARDALSTLNGRGLRDVEIAATCGMSFQAISQWRKGGVGITRDNLNALQQLVAVTNDLTGNERNGQRQYTPHPLMEEIRRRYESQTQKIAA